MEKQQFDELVKQVGEQAANKIKEEVANATKDMLTPEKLNEALKSYGIKSVEDITIEGKSLIDVLKAQGEAIEAAKLQSQPSAKAVNLATAMVEGYKQMLSEGKLKSLKKGQFETIELKSATTISTSNVDAVGTGSNPYNLSANETGVTGFVRRNPFIAQIMSSGGINKPIVQWTEMVNADGGAAITAEGASKSQYDFDLQEASMTVRKITAFTKVTTEMLDDIDFIEAEIKNELIRIIALKLDDQLLSGDGTGSNLKGIFTYATAFSAGNFAGYVQDAKEIDVLRVAIQQIASANLEATHIVLNPEDVTKMELAKDANGQYVMPPFASMDGTTVKGLPVVANNGVTAGTYLVGDFSKANLRIRKGASISIGLDSDDFTKNLVTILGEVRAVHYVKSQHTAGFVTGTFSTDIAAILKSA